MVRSGVPQGLGMGPRLFLVNISGLANSVTSLACLFTNDTILYHLIIVIMDDHITAGRSESLSSGRMRGKELPPQ